jgi:multiple sugar transport system ATP-binding protein
LSYVIDSKNNIQHEQSQLLPRITFDSVEKSYGPIQVLPPFNLELKDGEFAVLVGPSGCGKSTTLRMLAGLETLSGGEIWFDDRPVSRLEPKDRDIAMVFQDYALYPHMNVANNMSFALRLQKMPRALIDQKVNNVATLLGIDQLLYRKPGELSGGQRQRVAMGRALVRDAATFLFDEPLSNLDAKLRGKMRSELAEMRKNLGKNIVYVTHDQIEAMTLGDRIIVMDHGKIQQVGTPEALFNTPDNKFVAGFIGSPPMNFLDAEVSAMNGNLVAQGDGFALRLEHWHKRNIAAWPSYSVTLGIRPSCLRLATTCGVEGSQINLRIRVSEYQGTHSVLVTRCGKQEVLVETDHTQRVETGHNLLFTVAPKDIMVFAQGSGNRL